MRVVSSVAEMQRLAKRWRLTGWRIGLVPTMGCLHAGHISLTRLARRRVGQKGKLVVSIYVNPTQFGPGEDYTRYPRDLQSDQALCRAAGVDGVFAPADAEMYAAAGRQSFSTFVNEQRVSEGMEGGSRPTHFRGVTTIVAKLFNIVLPDIAVFGEKDFQQAAVIQRMTRDLNFPVAIALGPTVREADGLAMSSRNKYLSPSERTQATALWQAIRHARDLIRNSQTPLPASRLRSRLVRFIEAHPAARVDYLAFVDPKSLEPVTQIKRGVRLVLAVFIGSTRLIDNAAL